MSLMKLNIQFDDNIKIENVSYVVIDSNGKVREYFGVDFSDIIINSLIGKSNSNDNSYSKYSFDSDFTLIKLSDYDIAKFNKSVNYQLECPDLLQKTIGTTNLYLNLSFIQKFRIEYYKKETVFHKMNLSHSFIKLIAISIPLLLIGVLLKVLIQPLTTDSKEDANSTEKKEIIKAKKPDLKNIVQDNAGAIRKQQNILTQKLKCVGDSLHEHLQTDSL
jgi:hypothetical protein